MTPKWCSSVTQEHLKLSEEMILHPWFILWYLDISSMGRLDLPKCALMLSSAWMVMRWKKWTSSKWIPPSFIQLEGGTAPTDLGVEDFSFLWFFYCIYSPVQFYQRTNRIQLAQTQEEHLWTLSCLYKPRWDIAFWTLSALIHLLFTYVFIVGFDETPQ